MLVFPPVRIASLSLLVALLGVATACEKTKTDEPSPATTTLAENGSDSADLESHVSALVASLTLSTPATAFDQPARAVQWARATNNFFLPGDCLVTEINGTTVTHQFNGCAGPWGLLRLRGKVTVTYSTTVIGTQQALVLDITGDALSIQKATADFHAKATVSADGANRLMGYEAQLSGRTMRDRAVSRTVAWQLGWRLGEQCLRFDGTAEGTVDGSGIKTTVDNYQRCRGACPSAGGIIQIERTAGAKEKLRIEFNGGQSATVKGTNVRETDIKLACGLGG